MASDPEGSSPPFFEAYWQFLERRIEIEGGGGREIGDVLIAAIFGSHRTEPWSPELWNPEPWYPEPKTKLFDETLR